MPDEHAMDEPGDDIECYHVHCEVEKQTISFTSHWTGWADERMRVELRKPTVTTLGKLRLFHKNFRPLWFISDPISLYQFFLNGGYSAIECSLAKAFIPESIQTKPCASSGFEFHIVDDVKESVKQHAPSKKLRANILKRDNYRCRMCGQRPSNDPNITLHVHHIKPWSELGATFEKNLITLCHTCHTGLDPHWNRDLASFIDE